MDLAPCGGRVAADCTIWYTLIEGGHDMSNSNSIGCRASLETVSDKGTTLHIFVGSEGEESILERHVQEARGKALRKGDSIIQRDGTKEWIRVDAVWEKDSDGSHQLVWNEFATRIKTERIHVTFKDGERTEKHLGFSWRKYETVFPEDF